MDEFINYDKSIHINPDARAWAKFYTEMKNKSDHPDTFDEEAAMVYWFANAMMAMHDFLIDRLEQEKKDG